MNMKRMILLTGILLIPSFISIIYAQDECIVLLPRIAVTYEGSCRKGLADGQGEAIGIDHYIGEFRKGYPEGVGTYKWQTGETYVGEWSKGQRHGEGKYTFKYMERDSVLAGRWKEDKYIGLPDIEPYVIEYRNGIGRVTCIRTGDRPYVKYVFQGAVCLTLCFREVRDQKILSVHSSGMIRLIFLLKAVLNLLLQMHG